MAIHSVHPDVMGAMLHAWQLLMTPTRLLILIGGVLLGLALGVVPGLGGVVGLAVLIPFTDGMDPYTAFALLLGMAAVTTCSDFIPAVLFGVPGSVGAAATVIDGNAMARKGEAGRAFGAGFAASLAGGLFGAILLAAAIPVLEPVMLAVGSPELLAFSIFGLSMVASLSGREPLKGLVMACAGVMLSMVGTGMQTGVQRWTFDTFYLFDGIPLVPVTLGLFALPELADLAIARHSIAGNRTVEQVGLASQWQGVRDVLKNWWLVLRCSALGALLGAVPGIGSSVIDWIAYGYAKRTEKNSETFGEGDVRGVIAPESSNNAKEGGHLLPTIAFGVPGSAAMTLLLGAFLMHGLVPGPAMLTKNLSLTYTIVWSLTLAHIIGAALCVLGSGPLARLSLIRPQLMLPVIIPIIFIAAFQGSRDFGDLLTVLAFGLIGWILKRLGWPRPPLVLGLVLGVTFERYLFISTEIYGARWLLRPVVMVVFALIVWALYRPLKQIGRQFIEGLQSVRGGSRSFGARQGFSTLIVLLVGLALITSTRWPVADQLVARASGYAALLCGLINLAVEVFGGTPAPATAARDAHAAEALPPGITSRRALSFLGWAVGFVIAVELVGLVPSAVLFVFLYMAFGFGESKRTAAIAAGCLGVFIWTVFDRLLAVPWPQAMLGDYIPWLRSATALL